MRQYDDDDDDDDEEDDNNDNEDDDDVCSCHLFCPATSWLTSDGYPINWSVWVSLSSPYHLPDEKKQINVLKSETAESIHDIFQNKCSLMIFTLLKY